MSASDALAVLKKVPLFAPLGSDEVREIVTRTKVVQVEPGAEVFQEGQPGDAMYVVVVGEVEIIKPVPTGGMRVLATLASRAVFGEMSLLTDDTRSAGARAKTKASLLRIDRDDFRKRLDAGDVVALKMAAQLAKVIAARLRAMDEELVKLLAETGGEPEQDAVPTPLHSIEKAREWVMLQWNLPT